MSQAIDLDAILETGLAHHEAGRVAQATNCYSTVLAHDPDNADALNLLGVIQQDSGDVAASIASLQRAVAVDPTFAEAFANLARAQSAAGQPEAARCSAQQAIKQDPELAEAHLQLARALLALADYASAAAAAAQAAALNPRAADAHLLRGHACIGLNDLAGAEIAYRASDALVPRRYETALALTHVLTQRNQAQDAIRYGRIAVNQQPADPRAYGALGTALRHAQEIRKSADVLAHALRLAPDNPVIWRQQADNFALLGQFDDAAACYHRVLALDPQSSEALSCLAAIGKLPATIEAEARLQDAFADANRPGRERVAAGFALGGMMHGHDRHDDAFAAYAAANRLARDSFLPEDAGAELGRLHARIDQLRADFTPAALQATRDHGNLSETPVFIVGMPRSGTTLVEQILASHPEVHGAGECWDIPGIAVRLEANGVAMAPGDWDPNQIAEEAEDHIARLRALKPGALRVIDKLPDNILLLGHIAVLFPNARIILCRRDPRDIGLSCYFQPLNDRAGWAYDLADCAARIAEVERLTAHWRASLPLRMTTLDYETLVGDLPGESRRLVSFLGLDWDDACLEFQATERVVQTASLWQVRQKLYATSIGRWRQYRRHIQPLLDGLAGLIQPQDTDPASLIRGARAHLQAGRTEAAEAAFRGALTLDPNNPDAALGVAQTLRLAGHAAEAAAVLRPVIAQHQSNAELWLELAHACRLVGDDAASADAARKALDHATNDPAAYFLLGSALLALDDPTGARAALENAVKMAPDSRDANVFLAMACIKLNDFEPAVAALRHCVRLYPHDAECLVKLGRVLSELQHNDDALPLLNHAVTLVPDDGRAHLSLVNVLWHAGDVAAAAAACKAALLVAPDLAELWLHDGYCLAAVGKFSDAGVSYRRALAIDPNLSAAHFALVGIGLGSDKDTAHPRLRSILADPAKEDSERIAAATALGKLLDRSGDYDAAWDAYAAAASLARAALQASGRAYDADGFTRQIDAIIERFPQDAFQTGLGDPDETPVFVVGMPRSGTTLVEQIASSHAQVFGAGERADMHLIASRLDADSSSLTDRDILAREATAYLDALRQVGGDAARIIDKMPDNFHFLGHIAHLFPRARVIVCRRDYRDIALSCFTQNFGDNLPWSNDLVAITARVHAFDRLVAHWRRVLPSPMLEIRYEALVQDLEGESRRLIDFLGLDWDPACLAFHQTERTVRTASLWQVRQPLYDASVDRWRNYRQHLLPVLAGVAGLVPPDTQPDWDALADDPATARSIAALHVRAGRLDYAAAIYSALLRREPADFPALHLLGMLRLQENQPQDAAELLARALDIRPDAIPVLVGLAHAQCAAGDAPATITAAQRAIALDPTLAEPHLYLAYGLIMQQDFQAGLASLQTAVTLDPTCFEAWRSMGTLLTQQGNYAAAAEAWQVALGLCPDDQGALLGAATAMAELRKFAQALEMFRALDGLAPGQPPVLYGIATALMHTDQVAAAAEVCRQALEHFPDARFWLLLGNCEASLGNTDAAAQAYRSALALDPGMTSALHDLVGLNAGDDDLARQAGQAILHDTSRLTTDRVAAGFALGQVHDRHGDYDQAFAAYAQANQLLRQDRNSRGFVFDRTRFQRLIDRQIAHVGAPSFAATAGWGDPSEAPVFVVGLPRSGTSLVEQIAASHSQVFGAGERHEVFAILAALEADKTDCPPEAWDRIAASRAAAGYVRQMLDLGGAVRVIDKQPDNILCLGQIAVLFPRARVIVCRRDPRDIGLSCHFQHFRDDPLVWTNDLADCGFRIRQIERLLDHWRRVLPIPLLEVQYEALIQDQETESRRLIDFLDLPWDPACLSFHKTRRVVITASHWQVRQPVYTTSTQRWRHYQQHLGPLLQELNLPVAPGPDAG